MKLVGKLFLKYDIFTNGSHSDYFFKFIKNKSTKMKSFYIFLTLLFLNLNISFAQEKINETEKLASFCKVWGFLKYYHPNVVNNQINWDEELIMKLPEINEIETQSELSKFYIDWINSLGNVKQQKIKESKGESFEKNFDFTWIEKEFNENQELIQILRNIEKNIISLNNKELFKHDEGFRYLKEKSFSKEFIATKEYRVLDLFRYWNIIEYFFPYKYLIDQKWDEVLVEMIPRFVETKTEKDYTFLLYELFAKIDDGHAYFINKCNPDCFGVYWMPFSFTVIDNQIVINALYDKDKSVEFQKGDIILKVNHEDAFKVLNDKLKFTNGSNLTGKYKSLYNKLLNGDTDKIHLTIQRGNEIIEKEFSRYKYEEFNFQKNPNAEVWKILDNNIGYVNIGNLENKDIDEMYEKIKNTKAIIFDIRNYPNGTLLNLMNKISAKPQSHAFYTIQNMEYPGKFIGKKISPIGKKNKNPYSGKIIILVNEKTQSQSESIVMALQTLESSTTIGSQTAGANGDVSIIPMVFDGMETWISGIGFYYPDKSEIQRKGVKIHIEVKPTIEGIRNGKDEVLEKAIQFIEKDKQ